MNYKRHPCIFRCTKTICTIIYSQQSRLNRATFTEGGSIHIYLSYNEIGTYQCDYHYRRSIIMVIYWEILRLNTLKYTPCQIASSMHSSFNAVGDVINLASEARLDWPLDDSHTNKVLYMHCFIRIVLKQSIPERSQTTVTFIKN